MNAEEMSAKEKIILATIDQIEKKGIQAITVRSIATQAGVNLAAINYYFRSKEKLIDEVLKSTVKEFVGLWQEALESTTNLRERLREFCLATMEGAFRYPGITKAHLYGPLILNDYSSYFVSRFNTMLGDIMREVQAQVPDTPEDALKMNLVQLISSIILPALMPELFRKFAGFTFTDAETRRAYVDNLLDHCIYLKDS